MKKFKLRDEHEHDDDNAVRNFDKMMESESETTIGQTLLERLSNAIGDANRNWPDKEIENLYYRDIKNLKHYFEMCKRVLSAIEIYECCTTEK